MPTKILLIDDNETFLAQLKTYLTTYFFEVETAVSGSSAMPLLHTFMPDIVLLDVHMPFEDGLAVCRRIRQQTQYREGQLGIIMVSGERKETIDQVAGLEIGADKYLSKPIEPRVLVAEINSLLRLLNANVVATYDWLKVDERLRLNLETRVVELDGVEQHLTKLEFDVLAYLATPPNKPCSRSELAEEVWQEPIDDGPINRIVSTLRKKIEQNPDDPVYIKTVYGIGYKLVIE